MLTVYKAAPKEIFQEAFALVFIKALGEVRIKGFAPSSFFTSFHLSLFLCTVSIIHRSTDL